MNQSNIAYIEVVKDNQTVAKYFENDYTDQNQDAQPDTTTYGSTTSARRNNTADIFHKLIHDIVLPKVTPKTASVTTEEDNIISSGSEAGSKKEKVSKLPLDLIDGYDCYYSIRPATNESLVCFTRINTPRILPVRLLRDLEISAALATVEDANANTLLREQISDSLERLQSDLLAYKRSYDAGNGDGDRAGGVHGDDLLNATETDIQEVIRIMNDNIDKFLERQERVSSLVDRASRLNNNSETFKRKATKLKDKMWWRKMKNATFLTFSIILVVSSIFIFWYVL